THCARARRATRAPRPWCNRPHECQFPYRFAAPSALKPFPPRFEPLRFLSSLTIAGEPRAGVRRVIDREEPLGLDRGVALRRRQARIPQQLLNRPQIAARG